MSNLSNEDVQALLDNANDANVNSVNRRTIIRLCTALLEARRDLADIAKGLQDVGTSLDELKELL